MIARPALLLLAAAFLIPPAAAQSSRHVLKGDSVAIYNLVGELRVEPGSGSDVVVQVQRGGEDSAMLEIQSGPLRGRETLRIIYPDDVIIMPEWGRGWSTRCGSVTTGRLVTTETSAVGGTVAGAATATRCGSPDVPGTVWKRMPICASRSPRARRSV